MFIVVAVVFFVVVVVEVVVVVDEGTVGLSALTVLGLNCEILDFCIKKPRCWRFDKNRTPLAIVVARLPSNEKVDLNAAFG